MDGVLMVNYGRRVGEYERRTGEIDRRIYSPACLCDKDPWRYSNAKITGNISDLKEGQKKVWERLDSMLSIKVFSLFLSILLIVAGTFFAVIYDTNKQTLLIVTEINKKVVYLESQIITSKATAETTELMQGGEYDITD